MNKNVAIITGAAGGLGKAIVKEFMQAGYALALVDRSESSILESNPQLEQCPAGDVLIMEGDLTQEAFLQQIATRVMDQWGRIDALINNAMWRKVESVSESSLADWNKTLAIGITAPAFLSKYVAQALMAKNQNCTVINLSSVMSSSAPGYASAYTVCKGAIESLTYEFATRYGPLGFRAVAVRPGSIDTSSSNDYNDQKGENITHDIQREIHDRTPLKRSAKPAEIAQTIVWLCSKQASFITGTTLTVDGGLEHNFNSYTIKEQLKPNEF